MAHLAAAGDDVSHRKVPESRSVKLPVHQHFLSLYLEDDQRRFKNVSLTMIVAAVDLLLYQS